MAIDKPLLYRIPDVAKHLAVSRSQVYVLMRTGRLASVKVGYCRRVAAEELHRFIRESAATNGTAPR